MKVLVYGVGVIGSYLAHVLCAAGNDVTLLARGQRKRDLEERGLAIRHYLQRSDTVDRPEITDTLDSGVRYDAVFAVMQYQQMLAILPEGDDRWFVPGLRRTAMGAMLWVMEKTALGRLAASDHCRHAVSEMAALDGAFAELRRRPRFPMPAWEALRAGMPSWETLHRAWDAAG